MVEIFWSKKKKDKKQQGSLEDHQDPRLKVDEQNKQAENKKWRDNKRRNRGVGRGGDKSLNLSCVLSAMFVLCWFWPQVARRSPRKLPVSIQPYKLPHTLSPC